MGSNNPAPTGIRAFPSTTDPDTIFTAFEEDGCVIIKNFIPLDQVRRLNEEIEPEMQKIPVCATGDSNDRVKRFSRLMTTSPTFRHEVVENDLMHAIAERAFARRGGGMGYHFNDTMIIEIQPGAPAQRLHRDQELFPWWNSMGPEAPEAVLNFFCALSPFTEENGATRVVLGSHRWPKFTFINETECENFHEIKTIPALLEPGDCYLLPGKLIHGGGHNSTENDKRRGLAFAVIRRELRPLQAFPLSIPQSLAREMSERTQVMFGFRSSTSKTDIDTVHFWGDSGKDIAEHLGLEKTAKA